jgi:hypothetical protein
MSDEEDGEVTYQVVFDAEPEKKYPYLPPLDGRATATYPNKDTFVGEFKDGKKNGKGVYTFASGAKYDGEYVDNKKQGLGTYNAPDGGKYIGYWYEDKRHGQGVYNYPSGDKYKGEWKNGAKHGRGTYTYAGIDSSITGTWSNGQCVDGTWNIHDGSSYSGSFLANQPSGEGLYKFANGNESAGRYANGTFKAKAFKRPSPNAKPPTPVEPTAMRVAERLIDKCVAKCDHNGNMHLLKTEINGLANFRRVGQGQIYACGQPSVDAFRKLNDTLTEAGAEKIVSCNVREDPVVYVNQLPFSPRNLKALNVPTVMPSSLTPDDMKALETRMAENIKFSVKRKGNLHDYFEEMYENPDQPNTCTGNSQKTLEVKEPGDVRAISTLYEYLGEEDVAFEFVRIPLPEEGAPSPAAFDAVATAVRNLEGGAIVFNDAVGLGRATVAATIAGLLIKEPEPEEAGGDEEDEGDAAPKGPKVPPPYDELEPDFSKGQYDVIMKLVRKINGPTAEELEQLRVKEKEEYRAAQEAKLKEEAEAKAAAEAEAKAAALAAGEGDEPEEPAAEEPAPAADEGDEAAPEEKKEEPAVDLMAGFVSKLPEGPSSIGDIIKMEVDDAIDRAGSVLNLRTAILELQQGYKQAAEEDKDALLAKAIRYVERYAHLIIFAKYLKEQLNLGGEEAFSTTYASWCEGQKELFDILGTRIDGRLSKFEWI